jgi:hypothetical protein
MDLEELNRQMQLLSNEFTNNYTNSKNTNQNNLDGGSNIPGGNNISSNPISTIQIKKTVKSGEQRTDMNEKLNNMKMSLPMQNQQPPQHLLSPHSFITPQFSRNIDNVDNNQQTALANRHFNNQGGLLPQLANVDDIDNSNCGSSNNIQKDKRIDYRQNINNKLDNFIFDNPNATQFNPVINQYNNQVNNQDNSFRDSRMVIQDSNKDYYRQEANSRMASYSPLSRASNVPINMANMSVNDFYANMYSQSHSTSHLQSQLQSQLLHQPNFNLNSNPLPNNLDTRMNLSENSRKDNKELLNSRISEYTPLSIPHQVYMQNVQQQIQQQNGYMMKKYEKPNSWIPLNGEKNTNVVNNYLPIMSNK